MGIGGNFWEVLKPIAKNEGFDFIRDKKVAIDLSYWIVQHETAIKSSEVKNRHLTVLFFRTVNLISKFGAFPVFIMDGKPHPLKSEARISRFLRNSGINPSELPSVEERTSIERNQVFQKCVKDCMEMLKLFGVPVLQSSGEAEALCAQLNREGLVDACITADSDAFLFGAKCVIKCFRPNTREPFECYYMDDVEAALGLKRKHLIAISLLVGNDFCMNGVQSIGLDTALRFVKRFNEAEVLNRLCEIGSGMTSIYEDGSPVAGESSLNSHKTTPKKTPHCSLCGHPGNTTAHRNGACGYCCPSSGSGCTPKPVSFKCDCPSCEVEGKVREQKKNEDWHLRVCRKISLEQNFPNKDIIELYSCDNHATDSSLTLTWKSPKADLLVEFLGYHLPWQPSYVRQRMLPMLSTVFLREMAANPVDALLHGQYEFHSILRVKVRYGHQFYVVKWKKPSPFMVSISTPTAVEESEGRLTEVEESESALDESDDLLVHVDDGCLFLLTDENMNLVQRAFPEKVRYFWLKKEAEDSKRRKKSSTKSGEESSKHPTSLSPKPVQMTITEYYRSTKVAHHAKTVDDSDSSPMNASVVSPKRTNISPRGNLSKSVKRRLLFG
ncbi:Flap endonuclease GEN-like 1-like protein [Drosera capensis]